MKPLAVRPLLALLLLATSAQAENTLRLGIFPNVTHGAGLIAIQKGFFQKDMGATKLSVKVLANGSQTNEALAAGAIDAAYVGAGPAINAFLRGLPIQIYAGAANAGTVLVARKDTSIRTIKALDGKKVAVPTRGSTQDISLRHLLHAAALKATDEGGSVTVVPIDPANMGSAFASQQVDAALVQEPWGAALQSQGARLVADQKAVWNNGDYTTAVLVINTDYAKKNPEAVRGLLRGHLEAIQFAAKSNAGAQKAISDQIYAYTGQRLSTNDLFKGLARTKLTYDINLKTLAEYAQLNKEAGFARDVPDLSKLVNLSLVKSLAK